MRVQRVVVGLVIAATCALPACGADDSTGEGSGGHSHGGAGGHSHGGAGGDSGSGGHSHGGAGGLGGVGGVGAAASEWDWGLPPGIPPPWVPETNPMSREKVELGRHLFYDTRLSGNETQSCSTCHVQSLAFADGRALPRGSTGEVVPRNSPMLANAAYSSTKTWINPALRTLEEQIPIPLFGEFPVELGASGVEAEILARLRADDLYETMFPAAFPDEGDPFTFPNVVKSLASFIRTMISVSSPYDRYQRGDESALSPSAQRGLALFFEEALECHHCHNGFNFTNATWHAKSAFLETAFANTGLYDIDGQGSYPPGSEGLFEFTGEQKDHGVFRTPSLRNVAVTAPYLHDGSAATLEDVIRIYEAGGRNVVTGPNAGDGRANPNKDGFIHGFEITDQERADLIAFLESLTDDEFIADPRFANPF